MYGQMYGLTGRKIKPNYIGVINAQRAYLPEKKRLEDLEDYRNKTLALREKELGLQEEIADEQLEQAEKSSTLSSIIGLGQLGAESYYGRKRDKALQDILKGSTAGKTPTGALTPEKTSTAASFEDALDYASPESLGLGGKTIPSAVWGSLKENWGPIAASTLAGIGVGGELGKKIIGGKAGKAIGASTTSGALSYLATGDPYAAGISMLTAGISSLF